jgi:hypothetical protein
VPICVEVWLLWQHYKGTDFAAVHESDVGTFETSTNVRSVARFRRKKRTSAITDNGLGQAAHLPGAKPAARRTLRLMCHVNETCR